MTNFYMKLSRYWDSDGGERVLIQHSRAPYRNGVERLRSAERRAVAP
jgi:hypothetical protein